MASPLADALKSLPEPRSQPRSKRRQRTAKISSISLLAGHNCRFNCDNFKNMQTYLVFYLTDKYKLQNLLSEYNNKK